jgi:DNA invertase Pin-like site-specific DNA recombinase
MNQSSDIFFIYVRKSTDESDRQILSIQAQLFELQEFAEREGLTVSRIFERAALPKLRAGRCST